MPPELPIDPEEKASRTDRQLAQRVGAAPNYAKLAQQMVMPNYAKLAQQMVMPNYAKLAQQAVMPNYAKLAQQMVMPNYAKLAPQAIMPDVARLVRQATAMPDFNRTLRQIIRPPRIAETIAQSLRVPQSAVSVAGYRIASDALLRSIGFDEAPDLPAPGVRPTWDDTAFQVIVRASPETAAAISHAANKANNPVLPAHVIRNMLAWLVVGLIVTAYVGGTVLFPPWGPVVVAMLSASGVTAPAAYRAISRVPDAK